MAKYDEDLHDNPFFITLSEKFPDLFDLASEKCWMVIPPDYAYQSLNLQILDMRSSFRDRFAFQDLQARRRDTHTAT